MSGALAIGRSNSPSVKWEKNYFCRAGVKIRTCPDYWLLHSASAHQWSECEENIFVGGPNLDMSRVLAFALRKRPSVKCDEIILFGGQN